MSDDALLAAADALYSLPLGDFTPARDARAKEARADDRDLAAAVKALRKPSVAAWTLNLLVRRETGQVEQILDVATALRAAAADLDGDELRALTRQRRQLTAAVTTRARALAREHGQPVSSAVADQVEASLTAAMLDPEAARALRSGLLVTSLSSTGLDSGDLAAAVALPDALGFQPTALPTVEEEHRRPDLHVVPDPDAEAKARRAAEERLAEAEEELAEATAEADESDRVVGELQARSLQLQAELDELRRRIAELDDDLEGVDEELSEAEATQVEAQQALAEARVARDRAAAQLQG